MDFFLRQHGFRPCLERTKPISLRDYDAWAVEYERLKVCASEAWDAVREAREKFNAEYQAMPEQEKLAILNGDIEFPYKTLERHATDVQQRLWKHGRPLGGFWYRPGVPGIAWVGTRNPSRYYEAPKVDYAIVIRPGRAPTDPELERLIDEMIVALDQPELLKAAE